MAAGGGLPTGGPGPSRCRLPAARSSAEPSMPGRRLQVHQDRQEVRPRCQNIDVQALSQFCFSGSRRSERILDREGSLALLESLHETRSDSSVKLEQTVN